MPEFEVTLRVRYSQDRAARFVSDEVDLSDRVALERDMAERLTDRAIEEGAEFCNIQSLRSG